MAGIINLELCSTASDIRLPKNKAADTGQKESAKIIPNKRLLIYLEVPANPLKLIRLIPTEKLNLITFNKIKPTIINIGPINLFIECCRKFAITGTAKSPPTTTNPNTI